MKKFIISKIHYVPAYYFALFFAICPTIVWFLESSIITSVILSLAAICDVFIMINSANHEKKQFIEINTITENVSWVKRKVVPKDTVIHSLSNIFHNAFYFRYNREKTIFGVETLVKECFLISDISQFGFLSNFQDLDIDFKCDIIQCKNANKILVFILNDNSVRYINCNHYSKKTIKLLLSTLTNFSGIMPL